MASIVAIPEVASYGHPVRLEIKGRGSDDRLALWVAKGAEGTFSSTQSASHAAIETFDGVDVFVAKANWKVNWTPHDLVHEAIVQASIYRPLHEDEVVPTTAFEGDFSERYKFVETAELVLPMAVPQAVVARALDGDGDRSSTVSVTLQPADVKPTPSLALWSLIRETTSALSFNSYSRFMDIVLCGASTDELDADASGKLRKVSRRLRLPFPDTDAYRQLKVATEVFMMLNCGVDLSRRPEQADTRLLDKWGIGLTGIRQLWVRLIAEGSEVAPDADPTVLYLALVRNKLRGVDLLAPEDASDLDDASGFSVERAAAACQGILLTKLTHPCFLELIWNYWHEEALLVQSINAISWRFQNRSNGGRDPLALLEIDPLRPLNNFIWGWVQDEQHRLSLVRRAYEYDHHYGITLLGKAVPAVRGADSRTRFIEAFHNLLYLCSIFFKEEDDTTVIADGFTVLNALKEVHLLLTQGAHNQYGDLPWTARQEMLMEQWLLARPEFREFLPRRIMVDYPEEWMDSVETMKTLQGWKTASVMHFRDLGVFGEQILLGIRFNAWPSVIEPRDAANWARYWRPEIQGYIHAYRAATGVDLTEQPEATMPALLLQQRMAAQLPASVRARLPMQSNGNGRSAVPGRRR